MHMKFIVLSIILLCIIVYASMCKTNIQEGYFDTGMPNPDMIKKVPEMPSSSITSLLSDLYAIVKGDENYLVYVYNEIYGHGEIDCDKNSSYCDKIVINNNSGITISECCPSSIENQSDAITPDINKSNQQNIELLCKYMMKHEQILKILNIQGYISYIPSSDLPQIIDGTQQGINTMQSDLNLMTTLEPVRQNDYEECDIDKLEEEKTYWKGRLSYVENDDQRRDFQGNIDDITFKIQKLKSPEGKKSVKCNTNPMNEEPYITDESKQNKIQMLTLYYLYHVLVGQNSGIKQMQNYSTDELTNAMPDAISQMAAMQNQMNDLQTTV